LKGKKKLFQYKNIVFILFFYGQKGHCPLVILCKELRKSGLGVMKPEFPTTGLRKTTAISPLLASKIFSTAGKSFLHQIKKIKCT
jgi:hypothetical protein